MHPTELFLAFCKAYCKFGKEYNRLDSGGLTLSVGREQMRGQAWTPDPPTDESNLWHLTLIEKHSLNRCLKRPYITHVLYYRQIQGIKIIIIVMCYQFSKYFLQNKNQSKMLLVRQACRNRCLGMTWLFSSKGPTTAKALPCSMEVLAQDTKKITPVRWVQEATKYGQQNFVKLIQCHKFALFTEFLSHYKFHFTQVAEC